MVERTEVPGVTSTEHESDACKVLVQHYPTTTSQRGRHCDDSQFTKKETGLERLRGMSVATHLLA